MSECVSAFDGWGRAVCDTFASKSANPQQAKNVSFQNIQGAQRRVLDLFGFDLKTAFGNDDFAAIHQAFQKRHLFAHRMGVVDARYIQSTNDPTVTEGRKVAISTAEVDNTIRVLRGLANAFVSHLEGQP
ncbi:MAG: hypothetical protein HN348_20320 [Proteobacteria bacterium]|nr:hypothetical protein [Pseudomonadota bacterium]